MRLTSTLVRRLIRFFALLPSPIAYGLAISYADIVFRLSISKGKIFYCLDFLFGDRYSAAEKERVTRDHYRIRSCEIVDSVRLRGKGERLLSLVEVRGANYLREALEAGKGGVICSAHFSKNQATVFSIIGALGFPVTIIARWPNQHNYRMLHLRRSNIMRVAGNYRIAVQAAKVLRGNEFLGIMVDHFVKSEDKSRAHSFEFMGKKANLSPGAATIAGVTGSPVLVAVNYRLPDYRHQVVEIFPPFFVHGNPLEIYQSCLQIVDSAIVKRPAQWVKLGINEIEKLGLTPSAMS